MREGGRDGQFIELSTQKTGMLFTTRKLKTLNEELIHLNSEYKDKMSSLAKEMISVVGRCTVAFCKYFYFSHIRSIFGKL